MNPRAHGPRPAQPSSRIVAVIDQAVAWVLRVDRRQTVATVARRPLETPLLLVGLPAFRAM